MKATMDSTPPPQQPAPRLQSKSPSHLARIGDFGGEAEDLPFDPLPSSPKRTQSPPCLSPKAPDAIPLKDLLLLSPSPPKRSKGRLVEKMEMAEEPIDVAGPRRRGKNRASSTALLGCASPRNTRRTRRRLEQETREERDVGLGDEVGKARKRKQSGRSRKEKQTLDPPIPSSSLSPKSSDEDQSSLDWIWQLISDLIMWKDVAKSSLWFGFGSLGFLSSCFGGGLNFSIFSAVSQLGLLSLGISFFRNSFSQRDKEPKKQDFKLKEEDVVRAARVMLPALNLVISKTKELFSGEPSMTLKVAPILLLGAEYGHFISLWRLFATAFFVSFTAPKLYTSYTEQINSQVDYMRNWVWEAWTSCSHKKIAAASAATFFWNFSSIKTRIFAAFISAVTVCYYRQHSQSEVEGGEEQRQQRQE